MAMCLKCGRPLEHDSAKCVFCEAGSTNAMVANAPTENDGDKKQGKKRLGCGTFAVIAFVLVIPLFAIELPYPLGGSIGGLIFVGGFRSLVSGTPLGVKLYGECPATEKAQLELFLSSGQECLMQFSGYKQSVFPAMTREIANSRHPKTGKCIVEFVILAGGSGALRHLLKSGADPNVCPGSADELFYQILHRSRNRGYQDMFYALHDAKIRPADARKFLFDAAKLGSEAGIDFAVNHLRQPVDAVDSDGITPLYHAIIANPTLGTWAVVGQLIYLGADPNSATKHGESPLQKGRRLYEGTKWQPVFENTVQYETSRRQGKQGMSR